MSNVSTIATDRPALALVMYTGDAYPTVQPGYWQTDGSWADADGGPGGSGLEQTIRDRLSANERTVSVVCQSFTGALTRSYHYSRDDLPEQGGTIDLPTAPSGDGPASRFTLTITLGNAAMQTPDHVAGALREVADGIEAGRELDGTVPDANGNTVGSYSGTLPSDGDPDDLCTCGEPRELHDGLSCPDGNGEFELGRPA